MNETWRPAQEAPFCSAGGSGRYRSYWVIGVAARVAIGSVVEYNGGKNRKTPETVCRA